MLSASLSVSAALRTSGAPEALREHSVRPAWGESSSQGWPELRPARRLCRHHCHLCQDTNPHKTKRHKNKCSTVKNLNQKICLPGTQTWAKDESEVCLRHLRCLLDDRNFACKARHQVTNLARGRSQHLLALMS